MGFKKILLFQRDPVEAIHLDFATPCDLVLFAFSAEVFLYFPINLKEL